MSRHSLFPRASQRRPRPTNFLARPPSSRRQQSGIATNPIQLYHLGLWFDSAADAGNAGCPDTSTPFNGEHNAGIQVLNTATFPGYPRVLCSPQITDKPGEASLRLLQLQNITNFAAPPTWRGSPFFHLPVQNYIRSLCLYLLIDPTTWYDCAITPHVQRGASKKSPFGLITDVRGRGATRSLSSRPLIEAV